MKPLRILHLFSNWKWTGPAEPAVLLAAEQARQGHDVAFASGRPVPVCENDVGREARARGLRVADGLRLTKHRDPLANLLDRGPLRRLVREASPDVLVVHQPNDHALGAAAVRRIRPGTPIVRVFYDGELPAADRRSRRLYGSRTDGLVVFGDALAAGFPQRFEIPADRVERSDPPTDLARYDPERDLPDLRTEIGFGPGEVVVGIVARIQKHRKWEVLFEAFRRAALEAPALRLLVVGRGTHEEALAHAPSRADDLRDRVVLAGYRHGDEYVATIAAMDAKIFLVPGTDGTCRAAREAMAMGVPPIATRRGLLPEFVEDGVTGLMVDDGPESLAAGLVRLASDETLRRELGERARERARRRFDPARSAGAVLGLARRARGESPDPLRRDRPSGR